MGPSALLIKLRCASWEQLRGLYDREIKAGSLFLRSTAPPLVGTELSIDLTLPSGTVIPLMGRVARVIHDGPRGTGVDLVLIKVPPTTLWLIESALTSQRRTGSTTAIVSPPAAPAKPSFGDDTTFVGDEESRDVDLDEEPETAEAEVALIAALEGELAGMRGLNPFQLLDVGYDATDQDVRAAFAELSKKTHPDRFAQYESEPARALAAEMFVLVREAYAKIGDRSSRLATAAKLRPPTDAVKPDTGKTLARVNVVSRPTAVPRETTGKVEAVPRETTGQTEAVPREVPTTNTGRTRLSHDDLFGDLPEAPLPASRGATPVQLETTGSAALGEGERLLAAGQHDEALAIFESVLRQTPGDRPARIGRELSLGLRLVGAGDRAQATQHFETVLELDPLHELASRELAAIRRAFTESRKGVLNKLLGRKT